MTYLPKPIATADVQLPVEIDELVEQLAQHNHDVWATRRLSEGWQPGPRSDDEKTHPCLVPYDQLPDGEKEYDRQTAVEVLKAIVALGFRIEKQNTRRNGE